MNSNVLNSISYVNDLSSNMNEEIFSSDSEIRNSNSAIANNIRGCDHFKDGTRNNSQKNLTSFVAEEDDNCDSNLDENSISSSDVHKSTESNFNRVDRFPVDDDSQKSKIVESEADISSTNSLIDEKADNGSVANVDTCSESNGNGISLSCVVHRDNQNESSHFRSDRKLTTGLVKSSIFDPLDDDFSIEENDSASNIVCGNINNNEVNDLPGKCVRPKSPANDSNADSISFDFSEENSNFSEVGENRAITDIDQRRRNSCNEDHSKNKENQTGGSSNFDKDNASMEVNQSGENFFDDGQSRVENSPVTETLNSSKVNGSNALMEVDSNETNFSDNDQSKNAGNLVEDEDNSVQQVDHVRKNSPPADQSQIKGTPVAGSLNLDKFGKNNATVGTSAKPKFSDDRSRDRKNRKAAGKNEISSLANVKTVRLRVKSKAQNAKRSLVDYEAGNYSSDSDRHSPELFSPGHLGAAESPSNEISSCLKESENSVVETNSSSISLLPSSKTSSQVSLELCDETHNFSTSDESVSVNISISDFSDDVSGISGVSKDQSPLPSPVKNVPSASEWHPQIDCVAGAPENFSVNLNRFDDGNLPDANVKANEMDESYDIDAKTKEKFKLVNFSIKLEKMDLSEVDANATTVVSPKENLPITQASPNKNVPVTQASPRKTRLQSKVNQENTFRSRTRSRSETLRDRFRKPVISIARMRVSDRKRVREQLPTIAPPESYDESQRSLRSTAEDISDLDQERITFLSSLNLRSRKNGVKGILVPPKATRLSSKKVSFHLPEDNVLKERNSFSLRRDGVKSRFSHRRKSIKSKRKRIFSRPPRRKPSSVSLAIRKSSRLCNESEPVSEPRDNRVENVRAIQIRHTGENPFAKLEKSIRLYKKTVDVWYECTCCNQRYYLLENIKVHVRSHFPNCLTN